MGGAFHGPHSTELDVWKAFCTPLKSPIQIALACTLMLGDKKRCRLLSRGMLLTYLVIMSGIVNCVTGGVLLNFAF